MLSQAGSIFRLYLSEGIHTANEKQLENWQTRIPGGGCKRSDGYKRPGPSLGSLRLGLSTRAGGSPQPRAFGR